MPSLGPLGRGGARRRTRRRMLMMESVANQNSNNQDEPDNERVAPPEEDVSTDETMEILEKLARLLVDKEVISESEFNLLFG
ncbi:hypothetical protein [Methanobacterium petrolearium]|uniref:hypothetical protein n=1 Tax=Methanobacterium petrolearium TaxID=710190 RepID=UPI001AE78024|nr:hypothetical protein [Methanobacterium petrolearium]MBP1945882.1 hypothetical protein [Methanobacterium petrolearium]BDZ69566.1 hypothetical protein GCM10025861_00830 [Methanobacterium petrolearium]